ncbi:DUF3298 domain-containing protein [Caproicibacter fermentans]|uniref:DUF3298 domain-containing protein n=1 Tax=Caproicibacter fermentans TaxID=2576756 RepID=A0A7G8TEB1_9FIRM|nr:DUF3298 domain-containing protein [Caproicibacter fermentans]QNK41952.1 DUF3298 domain-containing protein [Caproicibacter fermentans]
MMRKTLAVFTAVLLILIPINCFAASNGAMNLKAGQTITQSGAYYNDGVLYLELEPVCRYLSYTVTPADADSDIRLTNGSDTIKIDPAGNQIVKDGHTLNVSYLSPEDTLGGGCMRLNGRLYMRSDLLSHLLGLDVQTNETQKTVTVRGIIQNVLNIETKRNDLSEGLLTATIQYPVLSGPWSAHALETMNGIFKQAADSAVDQGRKNSKELENIAAIQKASGNEYGGTMQCSVYFDYDIKYSQNGLFSVVLSNYQYAGGAHGSTIQTSYAFDLNTGKQLALSDFMKKDSGYQKFFDAKVRNEIDSRVKEKILFENTPFQTLGDNPDFYLSGDGITFYFQQYEYFPYAAGIQEFPVPFETISQMLNPSYSRLSQKLNRTA